MTDDPIPAPAVTFVVAPETTLSGALDAFLVDCQTGLSPKTVRFYGWELGRFLRWADGRGMMAVEAVTPAELRDYLAFLKGEGLKDTSQHCAARALRAWFNWLVREEIVIRSPMQNVRMPKVDKRILPALSPDDLRALYAACGCARDRLIVLCLLDTGCRVSEFVGLNVGDVNLRTGRVTVRAGKGGKDRITRIGDRARRLLASYLELERPNAARDAALWTSHETAALRTPSGRLTDVGLREILLRIGKRAGVAHCTPHTFRRTCALMMHRNGARLTEIQRLLGHADLATLQRYLALQEQDAEDAHKRHGPVDHLEL